MVQILPSPTNLGTQLGQALGQGLSGGLQRGGEIGFQRGMLQNALQGLENISPGTTPFQLASKLMQATAGIPGAERYVGQLYPLLLGQLRSEQAFGKESMVPGQESAIQQSVLGQKQPGGEPGGILGSIIPQDQIAQEAQRYAQQTGTGIEGAQQMQNFLIGKNQIALQQRVAAEQKAADIGIKQDEVPIFMQLGQKHKNAKTLDDWVRSTDRDFKEYRNLTKSLESASYPGFFTRLHREPRLKELDKTIGRLVNMGFEPQVREKLTSSGLSPAEVEERIHPFTKETLSALDKIPSARFGSNEKKDNSVKDFLQKNVNNNTSLLAIRNRLWEKGYDWQEISRMMNESLDPNSLTTAQINELGILEREPPRRSLNYIFREAGNIFDYLQRKQ